MGKLPYMPFYVADYLLDTQPLSASARGMWMDMLCMMWRDDQTGTMTHTVQDWCKKLRCTEADFLTVLIEFTTFDTCKILKDESKGIVRVTSRRLEREEKARKKNRLYVKRSRCKAPVRSASCFNQPENQNQSHISESESEELREEKSKSVVSESRPKPNRGSVLPDGFEPNERARALAMSLGINPDKELGAFKDHHIAHGKVMKDWQAAFRTWLRNAVKFQQRQGVGR